jgi:two-component system chemotaxis sensor kinase CheA
VRVRTETLDRFLSSVGEVILSASQLRTLAGEARVERSAELARGFDRMDRVVGDLQRRALGLRTAPLLRVLEPLPRLGRDLGRRLGKRVEVELSGAELELDRSILDRLGDPLVHLLRNAVDHGLEPPEERQRLGKDPSGRVLIHARREREHIRISVEDDGRGLDLAALRARAVESGWLHSDLAEDLPPEATAALVFRPGLSTRAEVSEVSGRGVGMDAVKATVEALGGRVELDSRAGQGTATSLVVPITAAIQRVLLVGLGRESFALPIARVERIVELSPGAIERSGQERFAVVDDAPVPILDLAERLGLPGGSPAASLPVVLAEVRGQRVGLCVERLEGQLEIYVKPVPPLLAGLRLLSGLTVLGDGRPIFLLDLQQLA